jgi:PAS domain S-box-containing protein
MAKTSSKTAHPPVKRAPDSQAADEVFRALAENAGVAIFICQGLSFKYVNPATSSLSGYMREELMGMRLDDLVHPDFRRLVRDRELQNQQGEKVSERYEFKILTKAGEERWVDFTGGVIRFEGQLATLGTAFDISERKRAELLQDAVYRIAQAADHAERLDDLLPQLHRIIAEVMTAKNFYIALYDREANLVSFPYFVDEIDRPPPSNPPGKGLTEYVLRSGKSQLVDLLTHDALQKRGEIQLIGAPSPVWLGVPLTADNKVIGAMVVQHYSDPSAYGIREQRILEFVSSQVGAVINRKRSEDALRSSEERYHHRAVELAALYETARDLATQHDLSALLNIVADRVMAQLGPAGLTIYIHETEHDQLQAVVARGWDKVVGTVLKMGEGMAGRIAASLQPLVMEKSQSWTDGSPRRETIPVTTAAGVPMLYSGEIMGVLTIFELDQMDGRPVRQYTKDEIDLLSVFAGTAASAVHNSRLFEETRQRLLELEVLYQASLASTEIQSPATVAQRVIETLEQLMNWKNSSIWTVDREIDRPVLMACNAQGLPQAPLPEGQEKPSSRVGDLQHGIVGWVCSHAKPVRTGDVRKNPHYMELIPGTRSELCVPLRIGGRTIGCIDVVSDEENAFGEHDERLLSTLAGQTAIAIENANLYQDALRSAELRSVLYQTSQEIARASQDPELVYAAVHRAANQLMNCDAFVITLSDETRQEIRGVYLYDRGKRHANNLLHYGEGISGRVIASGKALKFSDFSRRDDGIVPHLFGSEDRPRSVLAVPMRSGEKIIGMISAQNYSSSVYSEDDAVLLETLAANAGVAIENARLFEETRQRAVHQAALNTIIMSATRAGTDLDTLLKIALENTLRALRLELGFVWLTPHAHGISRFAVRGLSPVAGPTVIQILNSISLNLRQTDVVVDWSREEQAIAKQIMQLGISSSLTVPLLSDERRIGCITIAAPQAREWAGDEIALVEAVGREVGAATERARLFEETNMRLVELEGINRVSIALRQARSLDEILPRLVDEAIGALDAQAGSIWLFDPINSRLKQVIARGWCADSSLTEIGRENGIQGKVFSSGDVYFSSDVSRDSAVQAEILGTPPEGWSAVCVPILAEQEPIGSLFVSVPLPREFQSDDARLLVTIAEIAGNAIHRSRLHEQTERHAAELEERVVERTAELQDALVKAQEADRLKSEFIANVNHELRTPLTNLVLYYQMLRSQPKVKTEERLNVIGRELQRLRNLIENLLDLSRLDLGQVTFNPTPSDLNAFIHMLVDDRRSLAVEHQLTLQLELAEQLPIVSVDEAMIAQAISNLLTNAMNYTPAGGQVWVRTIIRREDGRDLVGLQVADNGLGIQDDEIPHLFERFYRGNAGHISGAPGTGLGLSIVQQIADRHHGWIEVGRGLDGKGAVFTLWIPPERPET